MSALSDFIAMQMGRGEAQALSLFLDTAPGSLENKLVKAIRPHVAHPTAQTRAAVASCLAAISDERLRDVALRAGLRIE